MNYNIGAACCCGVGAAYDLNRVANVEAHKRVVAVAVTELADEMLAARVFDTVVAGARRNRHAVALVVNGVVARAAHYVSFDSFVVNEVVVGAAAYACRLAA